MPYNYDSKHIFDQFNGLASRKISWHPHVTSELGLIGLDLSGLGYS
jgi:hypothetical protein